MKSLILTAMIAISTPVLATDNYCAVVYDYAVLVTKSRDAGGSMADELDAIDKKTSAGSGPNLLMKGVVEYSYSHPQYDAKVVGAASYEVCKKMTTEEKPKQKKETSGKEM